MGASQGSCQLPHSIYSLPSGQVLRGASPGLYCPTCSVYSFHSFCSPSSPPCSVPTLLPLLTFFIAIGHLNDSVGRASAGSWSGLGSGDLWAKKEFWVANSGSRWQKFADPWFRATLTQKIYQNRRINTQTDLRSLIPKELY